MIHLFVISLLLLNFLFGSPREELNLVRKRKTRKGREREGEGACVGDFIILFSDVYFKIVGRINLQSEDHIGLLIYGTFNASIPKSRIPSSTFEWKINEETIEEESNDTEPEESDEVAEPVSEERTRTQYGEWVSKETGAGIGGEDGTLEFNVME